MDKQMIIKIKNKKDMLRWILMEQQECADL